MGPDASSGLSNPRPNFEDPATLGRKFERFRRRDFCQGVLHHN